MCGSGLGNIPPESDFVDKILKVRVALKLILKASSHWDSLNGRPISFTHFTKGRVKPKVVSSSSRL